MDELFRFLNDFNSPACQQCIRFTTKVNLSALMQSGADGYRPVLQHMSMVPTHRSFEVLSV
jgi:hypothetical protein